MSHKTKADLKLAIEEQQRKLAASQQALITQFQETKESLKPVNLIKSTFQNVTGNSSLGGNLLKAGLGIGAAILTKRIVTRGAGTLVGRALGLAMNLGLVGAIVNPIKNKGLSLLKKFVGRENGKVKA